MELMSSDPRCWRRWRTSVSASFPLSQEQSSSIFHPATYKQIIGLLLAGSHQYHHSYRNR